MSRLQTALLYLALMALTVVVYAPLWKNGLVDFDDELYISTNPHVMQGLSWSGIQWAFTNYRGNYWQPVAWLSLQLDAQMFATQSGDGQLVPSTTAIHGHNLFWHGASALLLFSLWRRITGATWPAFLVAALFAVHPMHVESVAWAAERKDVLSVFFGIVTLWAYVWYTNAPGWGRYLCMAAVFVLSLMSKPMLITLPFVLLLLDYWPLRRGLLVRSASEENPKPEIRNGFGFRVSDFPHWGWLLLEKVPLLLLAAAAGFLTMLAREQTGSVVAWSVIPLSARLANAAAGYAWYLTHTIWPANLGVLYPHPGANWSILSVAGGLTALLAVTALAGVQARRRPWLLVGWFWFVVTLLPVIGLAQGGEQAWADRFSYWPHIGLFVALVWTVAELVERWRIPGGVAGAAAAVVLIGLSALTWIQVGYWRDTPTLWKRAAAVSSDNDVAHLHLGYYYVHRELPETARSHFAEAVRIRPDSAEFQGFLGAVLLSLGKVREASAHLQRAVELDPQIADAWHNLGMARLRLQEPEAAIACFRKLLDLLASDPSQSSSAGKQAEALIALSLAQLAAGKRSDALETIHAASHAAEADADLPALTLDALAAAQRALGQFPEAIQTAKRALKKAMDTGDTNLARFIQGHLESYERGNVVTDPHR
jgi:tetratricopeptide (TPR) repeat protein